MTESQVYNKIKYRFAVFIRIKRKKPIFLVSTCSYYNGGGGGNRTLVRNNIRTDFYMRSLLFSFPLKSPVSRVLYR